LEELLNLLRIIAKADGKITQPEIIYLRQVSVIFGFSIEKFERIYSSSLGKTSDPYQILGVTRDTPILEIKNKWKILATNHHPDKLIAQGLPIDFIEKTTHRLQEINNAWDIIKNRN
jgi:DnaJ like chaperone protein